MTPLLIGCCSTSSSDVWQPSKSLLPAPRVTGYMMSRYSSMRLRRVSFTVRRCPGEAVVGLATEKHGVGRAQNRVNCASSSLKYGKCHLVGRLDDAIDRDERACGDLLHDIPPTSLNVPSSTAARQRQSSGALRFEVQRGDAAVERSGGHEPEPLVGVEAREHRHSVADGGGVDEQVELVEQTLGDQVPYERAASVGDHVSTGLGLQLVHDLGEVAA